MLLLFSRHMLKKKARRPNIAGVASIEAAAVPSRGFLARVRIERNNVG